MLIYLLNMIRRASIFKRFSLFAVLAFMAAGCSENEEAAAPVFPEEEMVEAVTPGVEHTLSFSANMDWKVTSSALWCKFSNGQTSITGEAGEISLPLTITDEAWSVNEVTVDITLIMGGEEKVIAKYIRTGEDLVVMDIEGGILNEENKLVVSYSNNNVISETFSFVSNFSWELTEAPEWLSINLPLKVKANQKFDLPVQLNNTFLADSHEGVLRFHEQNSERYYDVPITYAGMPEGSVRVEGIGSAWNWTISLDGNQFWQAALTGGDEEVEKQSFPLSFKVYARNNEYVVRFLGQDADGWMNVNENLFYAYDDDSNGNLVLRDFQENTGGKRKGYVLAFPKQDYDEISHGGAWPDGNTLVDGKDVAENVSEYIIMSFEQEGSQTSSVIPIKIGVNGEGDVDAIPGYGNLTNPEVIAAINELWFVGSEGKDAYIFNYSVPKESFVTITPYIKNYNGENAPIGFYDVRAFSNPYNTDSSIEVFQEGDTYENSNVYFQCGQESLLVLFGEGPGMFSKLLILNIE